jgi:hypothetical protein
MALPKYRKDGSPKISAPVVAIVPGKYLRNKKILIEKR